MLIVYRGGRYEADGAYPDYHDMLKFYGFVFEGKRKVWWTDDHWAAQPVAHLAEPATARRLALDVLHGGSGLLWVDQGGGSTVAELEHAFGYRSPQLAGVALLHRTRLFLNGRPVNVVDRIHYHDAVILRHDAIGSRRKLMAGRELGRVVLACLRALAAGTPYAEALRRTKQLRPAQVEQGVAAVSARKARLPPALVDRLDALLDPLPGLDVG